MLQNWRYRNSRDKSYKQLHQATPSPTVIASSVIAHAALNILHISASSGLNEQKSRPFSAPDLSLFLFYKILLQAVRTVITRRLTSFFLRERECGRGGRNHRRVVKGVWSLPGPEGVDATQTAGLALEGQCE
ncbi:hypothetical protein J6590_017758 [Homalodisca vitripennis]|nr:hypothetical protein J6590_017758 [Homalodisca vitripennis]